MSGHYEIVELDDEYTLPPPGSIFMPPDLAMRIVHMPEQSQAEFDQAVELARERAPSGRTIVIGAGRLSTFAIVAAAASLSAALAKATAEPREPPPEAIARLRGPGRQQAQWKTETRGRPRR